MNKPAMSTLLKQVDSKYTLIVVAAKRARQFIACNPEETHKADFNPVTAALYEIADGKIHWERVKDGVK